jgi:hypothetical protein
MGFFENKVKIAAFCFVGMLAIFALGVTIYLLRPNMKMGTAQNDQEQKTASEVSEESVPEDVFPETSPEIPNEVPSDKHKDADERDRSAENQVLQNRPVAERIRKTCKAFDIQFPDDITTSKIAQRPPFRESMFQFSTSLGDVLGFDPIDGAFLWLMRHNLTEQSKSLGERAPLTAAEAAERLNEFGRAIGEPIKVSAEDAQYENNDSDNDASKDPDNGRWFFAGLQKYKDVPIFDSYFQADVSAVDGEILHYANRPLPPQEIDLTENVSQTDARSRTSDFINKMAQESGVEWQATGMGKKMIVYPNNCWTGGENTPLQRTGTPRSCWVERFVAGPRRVLVFVDTITGEIIGGM